MTSTIEHHNQERLSSKDNPDINISFVILMLQIGRSLVATYLISQVHLGLLDVVLEKILLNSISKSIFYLL